MKGAVIALCLAALPESAAFAHVRFRHSSHAPVPARLPLTPRVAAAAAVAAVEEPSKDGSSELQSTFNLCKAIMGVGSVALPASICAIGDVKGAIVPAVGILAVMGFLSSYTFNMIGVECARHGAKDWDELWSATVGPKSTWVITASVTLNTFLGCLCYSMILADLYASLALSAGLGATPLAGRSGALLLVTGLVLGPLCFLQSLAALAPFSLVGVAGILFSCGAMAKRFFDGSYLPGGAFFAGCPAAPSFGAVRNCWKLDHMAFVVLSCLSTAFLAHFNAPAFYNDLRGTSVPKFRRVVNRSFAAGTAVFAALMAFGFGTFGSATLGNVFVNYHAGDSLALLCRAAMCASITFTYPLCFAPFKRGAASLLGVDPLGGRAMRLLTASLLAGVTGLALVLDDLGFVSAVTGAIMGSLLIYVYPALMKLRSLQKLQGRPRTLEERASTHGILALGAVLSVVGVAVSVLKQFTTLLG